MEEEFGQIIEMENDEDYELTPEQAEEQYPPYFFLTNKKKKKFFRKLNQ